MGNGPPFVNLAVFPLWTCWDYTVEVALSQLSVSIPSGVAFPSLGSCTLGREKTLATVATVPSAKKLFFLAPFKVGFRGNDVFLWENSGTGEGKLCPFFGKHGFRV